MFKWIFIIFSLVLSATTVYAEDRPVSFSSAYTHLSKECKLAYPESEGEGQDIPLICKGFGEYQIYIWFSATAAYLTIQLKDDPNPRVFRRTIYLYDWDNGVVEWRMANGNPFAVIVRSGKAVLEVRGLKDFNWLLYRVEDKKGACANEEARKIADSAFSNPSNWQ